MQHHFPRTTLDSVLHATTLHQAATWCAVETNLPLKPRAADCDANMLELRWKGLSATLSAGVHLQRQLFNSYPQAQLQSWVGQAKVHVHGSVTSPETQQASHTL